MTTVFSVTNPLYLPNHPVRRLFSASLEGAALRSAGKGSPA